MKSAIVLGGAGFIGSHLTRRLLNEGYQVEVIDDMSVGGITPLIDGASVIVADVRDMSARIWATHFEHEVPDRIYFLPAVVNSLDFVRFPYDSYDITVRGLSNLIGGIRLAGTSMFNSKLIYFSSSEIYGNDTNADDTYGKNLTIEFNSRAGYDVGKMAGEVMLDTAVHQIGLSCRIVRPFNVYGPYEFREGAIIKLMYQSMSGKPMTVYGDGSAARTFTFIDDFLDGLELVVKFGNGVGAYNLSSEEPYTINEVVHAIGEVTGNHETTYVPQPYLEVYERGANISKVKTLGFDPKVGLREGLERVYEWMKTTETFALRYYSPTEGVGDAVQ